MTTLTPDRHSEAAFESVIEAQLLEHGYTSLPSGYTFDGHRMLVILSRSEGSLGRREREILRCGSG